MTEPYSFERKLVIEDKNHFLEALAFSDTNLPPKNRLDRQIMRLLTGKYYDCDELVLSKDFVKHSFIFGLRKEGRVMLSGGIILHGYEETLSVSLHEDAEPYYAIHT